MRRFGLAGSLAALVLSCSAAPPPPGADAGASTSAPAAAAVDLTAPSTTPYVEPSVPQFHKHANRDGFFVDAKMTEARAAHMHRLTGFTGTFSGNVYASPLYVSSGVGGKGTFYVATEANTVYALDEATGAQLWAANVGTPAQTTGAGCGNVSPIGITGTPAIDLEQRLIVFDAASSNAGAQIATHTVYGMSIDDGSVRWSVDVSTLTSGSTAFTPQTQNQRGAVLIVNSVAYVPYGGHYGDCGAYHGWVVGVPLSGTGARAWATTATGAGIWGVGGPASDGANVYVTTGNATQVPQSWAESEGLMRLEPDPSFSGQSSDFFSPYDWQELDIDDLDLSGSGPLVIDAPALRRRQLLLAQGKDGWLYLVDRHDLGGVATSTARANVGAMQVSYGELSNAGAWATIGGTTYVAVRPNGNQGTVGCPNGPTGDLAVVKIDPAAATKMSVVWCAPSNGIGSPSITSSDGTADPMVWVFGADASGTGQLYAWDLTTGAPVFSGGTSADHATGVRRFTTPIAAHGRVLVAGDGQLYAYGTK